METFFLFGRYTKESLTKISEDRTRKAFSVIQKLGGRVKSAYALLGDEDLVVIASLPNSAQATLASIALTKMTGISFKTSPAIPVDQFDKLFKKFK